MSEYQAIYDAVRSRIGSTDVGAAVSEAARQVFDISFTRDILQQEFYAVAAEMMRPSVLFRPTLMADGDSWCALLGDDLQVGVAGFGDTPAAAMAAFDKAFATERAPASADTRRMAETRSGSGQSQSGAVTVATSDGQASNNSRFSTHETEGE